MFTFSKKQLTMGLMMLLSLACCVQGSMGNEFPGLDDDDSSRSLDLPLDLLEQSSDDNKKTNQSKFTGNGWNRFAQYIGFKDGRKKRLVWTFLLSGLFIMGICAMAVPGCTDDHGNNIFVDEGASMWFRLSVMSLCLTFSLGMLVVGIYRAANSEGKTQDEYDNWKKAGSGTRTACTCIPEEKWNDFRFSKYSSRKLLFIFSILSMLLSLFVLASGSTGNCDNTMFHYAFMIPLIVGGAGFTYCYWRGRIDNLKAESPQRSEEVSAPAKEPLPINSFEEFDEEKEDVGFNTGKGTKSRSGDNTPPKNDGTLVRRRLKNIINSINMS